MTNAKEKKIQKRLQRVPIQNTKKKDDKMR